MDYKQTEKAIHGYVIWKAIWHIYVTRLTGFLTGVGDFIVFWGLVGSALTFNGDDTLPFIFGLSETGFGVLVDLALGASPVLQ